MILNESSFLKLFLDNSEVKRISRIVAPKPTNDLLLMRTAGVPDRILQALASKILASFQGRENLLTDVLGKPITIESKGSLVQDFKLTLSDNIKDPESLFPAGWGTALYRDEVNLYATLWK